MNRKKTSVLYFLNVNGSFGGSLENHLADKLNAEGAAGQPAEQPSVPGWHSPVLRVYEMSGASGDPTISDDGLGDGLFS
jgi:hypothetical protein